MTPWTAALVSELIEARDEKKLLRFQKQIASYERLIVDELGFVPLSKTGAELLFEMLSQRYERGSTLVTSNLPFQKWTEVLGSERLTGALLDRLSVADELKDASVDGVRSPVGLDVDDSGGRKTILHAEVVGDGTEGVRRIRIREGSHQQVVKVHVRDSVQQGIGTSLLSAVTRPAHFVGKGGAGRES
jgi:hypothetical protein